MMTSRLCLVAASLAAPAFARADGLPPTWEPSKTHGVVVGVCQYDKASWVQAIGTYKRKDQEFHDQLVKRGVPKENLRLLLDKDATRAGIADAVRDVVKSAPKGSTLVFYYAGRGGRRGDDLALACHDLPNKRASDGYPVSELTAALAKTSARRVILFGECAHSGGLTSAAKALADKGVAALSLTSADDVGTGEGTWHFTASLIDALRGDVLLDADGDGHVSAAELARDVADHAKHIATQRHGYFATEGFDSFRLAKAAGEKQKVPEPFATGQFVHVPYGNWRKPGRVVGHEKAGYQVRIEAADRQTITVPKEKLAPVVLRRYKLDETVTVVYGSQFEKAKVVAVEGDFHKVRYERFGGKTEEWVLSDRIPADAETKGGKMEVRWVSTWYPAVVLQRHEKQALIRYLGSGASWDEWVAPERLRHYVEPAMRGLVFARARSEWFPAEVIRVEDDKVQVRYLGCSDESNEWVTKEGLKRLDAKTERPALVEQKGAWRAAAVLRADGKGYVVRVLGEKEEEAVPAERVRLLRLAPQ